MEIQELQSTHHRDVPNDRTEWHGYLVPKLT